MVDISKNRLKEKTCEDFEGNFEELEGQCCLTKFRHCCENQGSGFMCRIGFWTKPEYGMVGCDKGCAKVYSGNIK